MGKRVKSIKTPWFGHREHGAKKGRLHPNILTKRYKLKKEKQRHEDA